MLNFWDQDSNNQVALYHQYFPMSLYPCQDYENKSNNILILLEMFIASRFILCLNV